MTKSKYLIINIKILKQSNITEMIKDILQNFLNYTYFSLTRNEKIKAKS